MQVCTAEKESLNDSVNEILIPSDSKDINLLPKQTLTCGSKWLVAGLTGIMYRYVYHQGYADQAHCLGYEEKCSKKKMYGLCMGHIGIEEGIHCLVAQK